MANLCRVVKRTCWVVLLSVTGGCHNLPSAPSDIPLTSVSAYSRDEWQHWIDADGDCQDTRQEVLAEESLVPPTFDARNCRVLSGLWRDEYTGRHFTNPSDLEIDHRVPLANAHRNGGWIWDAARKRAYANDLSDPDHLIAVSASANRSKSDRGPDAWRPPATDNWCHYASAWRTAKHRWNLDITASENAALTEMCS